MNTVELQNLAPFISNHSTRSLKCLNYSMEKDVLTIQLPAA